MTNAIGFIVVGVVLTIIGYYVRQPFTKWSEMTLWIFSFVLVIAPGIYDAHCN